MNNLKRISQRYKEFRSHPLTRKNAVAALGRYLLFHIRNRFKQEQTISWIEGLKFYARKGDAGLVANIYYGLYEFEESIFLRHFMKKDDLFLDIGANLGHYSMLLSGLTKCRSIAVEPVPQTFRQLCRNIKLNRLEHLIQPLNLGISNSEDNLFFSTDRNTMDRIVSDSYANSVQVKVTTIDQLLKNEIPDAIKLDVEGYEYFALKGANKILRSEKLNVLIMELNGSGKRYGFDDKDIFKEIVEMGFTPYAYNYITRSLIVLNSYNKEKFNTIFIRDEEAVQNRVLRSKAIKIKKHEF
ncbi:methyltransferase, FkbM family [Salinimicrobium sediminis]|uniref:Methyltransferase, FkbM family n=1 Tax=Salinimicrobium sediminis TaxID=1343891 RepID=A0A285WZP2_9FLAO|nr:FkbM family methyltransferase [Salinimicrobium sediminis]SOC78557.1 methyltransferase, FkbM family [Salinimicrobium sediminis]